MHVGECIALNLGRKSICCRSVGCTSVVLLVTFVVPIDYLYSHLNQSATFGIESELRSERQQQGMTRTSVLTP
jgi:hypothetical protein